MKERPALFQSHSLHFRESVGGVAGEAATDTPEIPLHVGAMNAFSTF